MNSRQSSFDRVYQPFGCKANTRPKLPLQIALQPEQSMRLMLFDKSIPQVQLSDQ
jgi:hypothetical protein